MPRNRRWVLAKVLAASLGLASSARTQAPPEAPAPAPQERVAAIRKSFQESQARLRQYEWVETTVTTHKGEEKSRTQDRCYYGAEGTLVKIPLTPPPEDKPGRGLRGRIKERKKEEMQEYMEKAGALVHRYMPPDHEKIQKCKDAGKASIDILEPGKRARLVFRDYLQDGDKLSIEIDLVTNRILALSVATYIESAEDAVTLNVKFDTFPDGTIYTSETVLDAKAKEVGVTVTNSGYRKMGS